MAFAVEKGLVFTKCFREFVRSFPSTLLTMLFPTMNTGLDFWGWLGFEIVVVIYLSLSGGRFSLFITWLISFTLRM